MPRSLAVISFLSLASLGFAQDTHYAPVGQQLPGPTCLVMHPAWEGSTQPCSTEAHELWLRDVNHWRAERRIRIGYAGTRYERPELEWTQSSFIQPQMMVQERFFYDSVMGKYTVGRYLDDLDKRYGGVDAVLIWPTYPNMGIDNRNQLDMIRAMPGGLEGVKGMIAEFHRRGVRVLFPMMMWDQGTREPGMPWPDAIATLMKEIGADGVNGDTQDGVPLAFSQAADKVGHPLAFEPEGSPSDEALAWNLMTWGQYKFQFVPTVDRFKWLESRHMVNISDRWNRTKTDDLQFAFFNGVGWESWENIWGIWNGITRRDSEATRRMAAIERAIAAFLVSPDWEPFYPLNTYGVFASKWPLRDKVVWTIVNRNEYDFEEVSLPVQEGFRYLDLYHGKELTPNRESGRFAVSFAIEAHGFGAIMATPNAPEGKIKQFLDRMKGISAIPLSSYSAEWKALSQQMVEILKTLPVRQTPAGMVKIPGGSFDFTVEGIEIEGSDDIGVDVQYPWEDSARRFHRHGMKIQPFYMDRYPVTNAQFKRFMDATRFRPKDNANFLRDWKAGQYPSRWDNKPVTWVSLEDARAYAKWAGKRLPHEWEWQFAAQGTDGRAYPWGNDWRSSAVPVPDQNRNLSGPEDTDSHPAGASPFGVMDLVGNIWQWTDEYMDEHTRAAILRGGSYYQPQGSIWYFPQAFRNDQHGKLLLMAPSYDRAATLGFRCVVDAD
ncbi:MAG: SUMF1/EgtB/PvdO family nonheme iron enzyme [Acidobacteriaceae bacterium]|nr:SUMF1/EgtB/PvdO family nonheme iron enzyme [Acidobacteriaceae bacterium]